MLMFESVVAATFIFSRQIKYDDDDVKLCMYLFFFIFNIYSLVNIQRPWHDASHCDWRYGNSTTGFRFL